MDRIKSLFVSEPESPQQLKTKNFPPCYPLMYHSLSECGDRKILALLGMVHYALFILFALTNFLGMAVLFFSGIKLKTWIQTTMGSLILSAFWLLLIPIVVFFAGYLVTYKACTSTFFLHSLIFIITHTIFIIFSIVMALGLPNTGGLGLFTALLAVINGGALYVAAIWSAIQLVFWLLLAGLQFAMLVIGGLYMVSRDLKGQSVKGALLRGAARNIL